VDRIIEIIRRLLVLCIYVIAAILFLQLLRDGQTGNPKIGFDQMTITIVVGCVGGGGLLHIIINWVFSVPMPWKKEED
jgi:hypothetical protein